MLTSHLPRHSGCSPYRLDQWLASLCSFCKCFHLVPMWILSAGQYLRLITFWYSAIKNLVPSLPWRVSTITFELQIRVNSLLIVELVKPSNVVHRRYHFQLWKLEIRLKEHWDACKKQMMEKSECMWENHNPSMDPWQEGRINPQQPLTSNDVYIPHSA